MLAQSKEANPKVLAAYSSQEIASMSAEQIENLNLISEKLCWFEEPKGSSPEIFQMKLKNESPVVLTPEQIANFNPLLYILPQEQVACSNLTIVDSEGNKHLLIVRSSDMMKREAQRSKVALQKNSNK